MSGTTSTLEVVPRLRRPKVSDGAKVAALVRACPPLEPNTEYAYLLLCDHFAGTSVVAEQEDQVLGFVGGYRLPERPDTVFVWQVAVSAEARGLGLGRAMLHELLDRPECAGVTHLETTVSPSNTASAKLFRAAARDRGAECVEDGGYGPELFGEGAHEAEVLFRIGPVR